jgi:hypothetical protein
MNCRCGHARYHHRATTNAISKARKWRRKPQAGCRFGVGYDGRKACPCRDFVEVPR